MFKKFLKRLMQTSLLVSMLVTAMPTRALAANETGGDTVFENFVSVDGTKLMDGDQELRFISLNYPQATSDNAWEQENAIKTIKAMGGNVTRSYTIPVYNGFNSGKAYVTGVDSEGNLTFDEDALNELDQLLATCNQYGIRLVIPLVDHWHWIGGMDGYVWLAGESDGNACSNTGFQSWAWNFYSNDKCKDYFKQMISHLLERENSVTGVKYKNDKAILCWETANEAGGNQTNQQTYDDVLSAWTIEMVNHIKSIDGNHLVLDGRMSTTVQSRSAENPADILGAHYYEGNYATRCADDTRACHEAGKPFILGEFGAKTTAEPCVEVFQKGIENGTNGIMMWSLRAHKDGYGYYFHDEDGYWAAYHWPGFVSGDYYGETEILRAIYAYAQILNGNAANYQEAKEIPIPAPDQTAGPLLYGDGEYDKSFLNGSVADIKYRGVVGASSYELQRIDGAVTDTDDPAWTTIADDLYDSGRNWENKSIDCIAGYHDQTALDGHTYSYRIRGVNESGHGPWSNIVTVSNVNHKLVDGLDLIAVSANDPNPTEVRNTYSYDHSANVSLSGSTIVNKSETEGYIEYKSIIPVDKVTVKATTELAADFVPRFVMSENGITYDQVDGVSSLGSGLYSLENISQSGNYYYVRIYIAGQSKCILDSIELTYINQGDAYLDDGFIVGKNLLIQDKDFGKNSPEQFAYKNDNWNYESNGIAANEEEAVIIYKTGDDINAYRVSASGEGVTVEQSFDGVTFTQAPSLGNGLFGDLDVATPVRVIRVKAAGDSSAVINSVEISSGTKSIPLAAQAPPNVLEDGEYYFGQDTNLEAAYQVSNNQGSIFTKDLGDRDFGGYDSLYVWLKGKAADSVVLTLEDKNGNKISSTAIGLEAGKGEIKKLSFADFAGDADMDMSHVSALSIKIAGEDETIKLDSTNVYTGNYSLLLGDNVYVDSIYVNDSSKVDDFESYSGSTNLLKEAYSVNSGGGNFDMSISSENVYEGSYCARIDYNYAGKGYAGANKTMDLLNLSGSDGFELFVYSDGSDNDIKIQVETDVSTFSYTGFLTGKGPVKFYCPFSAIREEAWAGSGHVIDSSQNLKSVAIYTDQTGATEEGTIYVDDIKGANFVEDLNSLTSVTLDLADGAKVEDFPFEITGSASYVEYVTLYIGDRAFNVPVNSDGNWSYEITADSGITNGQALDVKAGAYYPNKEVIAESETKTLTVDVEGNDGDEFRYESIPWTWDFGTDGTSGWTFEGFTPWVENENLLVAWSQSAFDSVFSYQITDLPNGSYVLENDIKVKSNITNAQMALATEETEVKSAPIDTGDVLFEDMMLENAIEVTDGKLTIKYYVAGPDDPNGATFALKDLKLYLVRAAESSDEEGDSQPGSNPSGTGNSSSNQETASPTNESGTGNTVNSGNTGSGDAQITDDKTITKTDATSTPDKETIKTADSKTTNRDSADSKEDEGDNVSDSQESVKEETDNVDHTQVESQDMNQQKVDDEESAKHGSGFDPKGVIAVFILLLAIAALAAAGIYSKGRK